MPNIDFEGLGKSIAKGFSKLKNISIKLPKMPKMPNINIKGLGKSISEGLVKYSKKLLDGFLAPFKAWAKLDIKVLKGINTGIKKVGTGIKDMSVKIKESLSEKWDALKKKTGQAKQFVSSLPKKAWDATGGKVVNKFNSIKDGITKKAKAFQRLARIKANKFKKTMATAVKPRSADDTDAELEKEQAEEKKISRAQKLVNTVVNIEKILKKCCEKKSLFGRAKDKLKSGIAKGGSMLGGLFSLLGGMFKGPLMAAVGGSVGLTMVGSLVGWTIKKLFGAIKMGLGAMWKGAKNFVWPIIKKWAPKLFKGLLTKVLPKLFGVLTGPIGWIITGASLIYDFWDEITEYGGKMISWVGDKLSSIGNWFGNKIDAIGDWFGDKINSIKDWVKDKLSWLPFMGDDEDEVKKPKDIGKPGIRLTNAKFQKPRPEEMPQYVNNSNYSAQNKKTNVNTEAIKKLVQTEEFKKMSAEEKKKAIEKAGKSSAKIFGTMSSSIGIKPANTFHVSQPTEKRESKLVPLIDMLIDMNPKVDEDGDPFLDEDDRQDYIHELKLKRRAQMMRIRSDLNGRRITINPKTGEMFEFKLGEGEGLERAFNGKQVKLSEKETKLIKAKLGLKPSSISEADKKKLEDYKAKKAKLLQSTNNELKVLGLPSVNLKDKDIESVLPMEFKAEQAKAEAQKQLDAMLGKEKTEEVAKTNEDLLNVMHGTKKDQAQLMSALIEQNNAMIEALNHIASANGALVNISSKSATDIGKIVNQNEEKVNKVIQRIA